MLNHENSFDIDQPKDPALKRSSTPKPKGSVLLKDAINVVNKTLEVSGKGDWVQKCHVEFIERKVTGAYVERFVAYVTYKGQSVTIRFPR